MPNPVLREPAPSPVPGAAALISLGRGTWKGAPLDGLPERRTLGGRAVIHLGGDPRHPGEAWAIGGMSDAWLDALLAAVLDERGARLPAPSFTPHGGEG
jgi:hypothetical protein